MTPTQRLVAGLLRPQGLLGLLLFVVGLAVLLSVSGRLRVPPPAPVVLEQPETQELTPRQVELLVVDAEGLETPVRREIGLPEGQTARLQAILGELQTVLGETGVWPEGLELPTVFVVQRFSRRVAVLDFTIEEMPAVTLEQELQTLESIDRTLRHNGMDAVQVLVNGREAETLLGHVALDAGLE